MAVISVALQDEGRRVQLQHRMLDVVVGDGTW